jgi:hypothetical protein
VVGSISDTQPSSWASKLCARLRRELEPVFSIDLRSLALFRISLALLLFAEICDRAVGFTAHYTDRGILPSTVMQEMMVHNPSLLLLSNSEIYAASFFVIAGLSAIMMLVGWHTRIATIAMFITLSSIQTRNPLINHNGDALMRFLVMWAMFLPLGAYYSLDARAKRVRPDGGSVYSVASAALLLQGMFIYFVVAVSKFQYDIWWAGNSLWSVLQIDSYVRPFGEFLLGYPDLVALMAHGSMFMEALFPILMFFPWQRDRARTLCVLLATLFQLNIFAVASIGTFQPLTILALFPFLPAWFWERFTKVAPIQGSTDAPERVSTGLRFGHVAATSLVSVLLAYTVASNLSALPKEKHSLPGPLASVGFWLNLDQRWRMFANAAATPQGWRVVAGQLSDGRWVDMVGGNIPPNTQRPENYSSSMINNAWRIYWSTISQDNTAPFREPFGEYLCNDWNSSSDASQHVDRVEVIYFQKFAHDREVEPRIAPKRLLLQDCGPLPPEWKSRDRAKWS